MKVSGLSRGVLSPRCMELVQSIEALNRTRRQMEEEFQPFLSHWGMISPAFLVLRPSD